MSSINSQKPQAVFFAEIALWIWTVWACLFGVYQTWKSIPELMTQMQGLVTIEPQTLLELAVVGYGLGAALSVWAVLKIGEGKNWARSSLMWGFILEVVWTVCQPPHGMEEYLTDVPDFALQGYAIYLLYTQPGRNWFHRVSLLS